MKIVLATPLYPPDVAEPAPYVKELARRLVAAGHEVTAVVYGAYPEQVPGVHIEAVDKRQPLLKRLVAYMRALRRAARGADIVFAENGPAVEAALVVLNRPYVLHLGDRAAHARVRGATKLLEWLATRGAVRTLTDMPAERPEILPFAPRPDAALADYERSWEEHIKKLTEEFLHAH